MADNVTANSGSGGAVFATDEVAAVHYPRSKVVWGPDGTVNDTAAASGKALPVQGEAAHDAVTTGNPVLLGGYAKATAPTNVSADGDVARVWVDLAGRVQIGDGGGSVTIDVGADPFGANADAASATGSISAKLRQIAANGIPVTGTVTVGAHAVTNAGTFVVQENGGALTALQLLDNSAVDHDATVVAGVTQVGLNARTSDGTAVASGDAVRAQADTLGKQVVLPGAVPSLQTNGKGTFTNITAADLIAAAGVGIRIAVTSVLVTNGHATVGTKVEIRDGTTVKLQGYAAPAGGGFALNAGGAPLMISTANTAITGRAVTTSSDIDIFVSGYTIAN